MFKVLVKTFRLALLLAVVMAVAAPLHAQDGVRAQTIDTLNMRTGPGRSFDVMTKIPIHSIVIVEGRNRIGDWVLVHTEDSAYRGWVATRYLILPDDFNLAAQPVLTETMTISPEAGGSSETPKDDQGGTILPALPGDTAALIDMLKAIPVLPNISGSVVEIFLKGQRLGNRADVFAKVGDCHTDHYAFLLPIGNGYYDLGPYGYLQDTINFFSATHPRPDSGNSFNNQSMAADSAFTFGAIMDPIWSNPALCSAGEKPLECEYRLIKPAVAVIMLGEVDLQFYSPAIFEEMARWVVQSSIDLGVIPILSTFPAHPNYYYDRAILFNSIIAKVAQDKNVPLVNLWLAAQELPNLGLEADNFHMTFREDTFISFSGDEKQYSMTLRNLLTLQALDAVRKAIGR